MLYAAMMKAPRQIVAVETDAIYSLLPPEALGITVGDRLGEWGCEVYDEMIYVQSGMYHYRKDGEWKGVRSRGINRSEYPVEIAEEYLRSLKGGEEWGPMHLTTKPRFIGAGAAINASEATKEIMTSWRVQEKTMTLGDTGKRTHVMNACRMCKEKVDPWDVPHRLVVQSRSDGATLSFPRRLPWEEPHPEEVEEIRLKLLIESELISR